MFWKIYCWFLGISLIIGYVYTFFGKSIPIICIVDLIISFPALIGFFLYAYRKRWINAGFWKAYLPIYILGYLF